MKKPRFTKNEKRIIFVLMFINFFALFVNLFEISVRITKDKGYAGLEKHRYYLFTDTGERRMGISVNGEYKHPPTRYKNLSSEFYPFVDYYIETRNEERFRGIFPGFDHTEFLVYTFLIIGIPVLIKMW